MYNILADLIHITTNNNNCYYWLCTAKNQLTWHLWQPCILRVAFVEKGVSIAKDLCYPHQTWERVRLIQEKILLGLVLQKHNGFTDQPLGHHGVPEIK